MTALIERLYYHKWNLRTTPLVLSELNTSHLTLILDSVLRSLMTCCLACDRQFRFRKTQLSGYDCCKKYILWYALCYSYTRTRCKRAKNRIQRHTSSKETRFQSLQQTFNFLRGQPNKKLKDRQIGPFTVEEQIGKHNYSLKLQVRLHNVFLVNNLRPCSTVPLRPALPVTVP
jgi:hypothetical protein